MTAPDDRMGSRQLRSWKFPVLGVVLFIVIGSVAIVRRHPDRWIYPDAPFHEDRMSVFSSPDHDEILESVFVFNWQVDPAADSVHLHRTTAPSGAIDRWLRSFHGFNEAGCAQYTAIESARDEEGRRWVRLHYVPR